MTQVQLKQTTQPKKRERQSAVKHHLKLGSVVMILHTWEAESLFQGRWQHGYYGFSQYAKTITKIWEAYKEGDPYAEAVLVDIQKKLTELKERFNKIQNALDKKISNLNGFQVTLSENEKPMQKNLYSLTPLGYMGAYLLRDLDLILRTALTLKQLGVFLKEDFDVKKMLISLRRLYEYPSTKWRYTGITREDIQQNNVKAQQAKSWMGEISQDILNKNVQFQYV